MDNPKILNCVFIFSETEEQDSYPQGCFLYFVLRSFRIWM